MPWCLQLLLMGAATVGSPRRLAAATSTRQHKTVTRASRSRLSAWSRHIGAGRGTTRERDGNTGAQPGLGRRSCSEAHISFVFSAETSVSATGGAVPLVKAIRTSPPGWVPW